MSDGITLDWSEFDRAMVEYAAASGRDFTDAMNKKMADVGLRAAQFSDKANKAAIKAMYTKSWWPKFIQKIIHMQGGFTLHGRRKLKAGEEHTYIDTPTRQRRKAKTIGTNRKATGTYKDAVLVSKAIIRRRVATVGMFKAVFSIVALRFGAFSQWKSGQSFSRVADTRGGFGGIRDYVLTLPAYPEQLTAEFLITFKNTKQGWPRGTRPSASRDVETKLRLGTRFLKRGIDFVTRDMDVYTQRKMEETARRYSAK